MPMSVRQMEVFNAIMRAGSVTGAAKLLNISQPAVSAVLRHCEAGLGMRLFDRIGGRLQPTPEAHALYPDIAGIFRRIDKVGEMSRDLAGGKLGSVSVAGSFPLIHGLVTQAMAAFQAAQPEVTFFLQTLTTQSVLDRLLTGEVDLGVCFADPPASTGLVAAPLAEAEIACILPADHPLAARAEITPQDLDGLPLITYTPQSLLREPVDRAFLAAGRVAVFRAHVDLSLTGLRLVQQGFGIAIVDARMVSVLALPGLAVRPMSPPITAKANVIYLAAKPRSTAVVAFLRALHEVAGSDKGTDLSA